MKTLALVLSFVLVGAASSNGVELIKNWERTTCKVLTPDSTKVGTGFMIKYKRELIFVTAKHVAQPGVSRIRLRLKEDQTSFGDLPVDSSNYYMDPESDLALICLTGRADKITDTYDLRLFGAENLGSDSMAGPGTDVYFLGYPAWLYGRLATTPLVRPGMIAAITDRNVWIDGNVFGGSSGSPLLLPGRGSQVTKIIGVMSQKWMAPVQVKVTNGDTIQYIDSDTLWQNFGLGLAVKVSALVRALDRFHKHIEKESTASDSTNSGE